VQKFCARTAPVSELRTPHTLESNMTSAEFKAHPAPHSVCLAVQR
jgi:hypothetical protein